MREISVYFQKPKNKLYIVALAIGVLLFLSGCKSAELQAIENSASVLQLTTGREIERYANDRSWGPFVVSIQRPEVKIRYEPINNYTTKEVFDEITAILIKNNWKDKGSKTQGLFKATLQQQGRYPLYTSVVIDSNKNIVSIRIESP
jgi:hypothetical protein